MSARDPPTSTDVLVIGAGPGGYVAAIRAAQLGLDVTLVEKDAYGGTCLNHGCIPSKALISATDLAHRTREASHMGIHAELTIEMSELVAWKDQVVEQLTSGVEKLCKGNGVTLVEGAAEFTGENTVRITNSREDDTNRLEFEHAIVATGSQPVELPGFEFDGEQILSSRDALAMESIPDRLIVVGAGYIGMELATVFAKAGANVTVIEMLDEALPGYGADVTRVVKQRATELGIEFHFEAAADSWERTTDGITVTTTSEDGGVSEFTAEKALVAVGRKPVTETVSLEAAGVETDEDGFVPTDDYARTNREHIFAVGDVAGEPMLAHKGMYEGEIAAEYIAGGSATVDPQAIPAVVFTDPEIATVGMTEAEAAKAGFDPIVGEMHLRGSGRALTMDEASGFVRVIAAETGNVVGAQIVAPEASELIAELGLVIESEMSLDAMIETVHAHPTLSETVREAAANAAGQAIHTLNR
ncbi:dihydrolipoyl dehydrogenase [Natronococcus occultus]|uniref:Dihydrolipoyl dehydrogenase n=1 Tax=Natronococcus occultus SP4 TaxID=694430 RepID=L0K6N1_9EURY|nr:dihydrolipoyl dehydrogenase [Natronococcus occultus]AGB40024.1 pyruvate/2-oxoglutarate dehydrogenase complex, dihydrolipoamide dehydrogenase component [Natronococcus occultus SP4]